MAMNDERPEFFKVFVPKFSSERMLIPPAFVRKYISNSTTLNKNNTCIRDSNGKPWNTSIARDGKKLYFKGGWKQFCKAHSLQFGDFLLFGYNAFDSSFTVKIFSENGCKKEFPAGPLNVCKAEFPAGPSKIIEIDSDHEEEKPRLANKIVCELQKSRAERMKKGSFSVVFKESPSFKYGLRIPGSLMKEINFNSEVVIRDEENKIWPVRVYLTCDGRGCIGTGWSDFRKDKNLIAKDKLFFEPVFSGQVCKEFIVRVIRAKTH